MRKNWYSSRFIIGVIVIDIGNKEPPCAISNKAGDDLTLWNDVKCDHRFDAVITASNKRTFNNNSSSKGNINFLNGNI